MFLAPLTFANLNLKSNKNKTHTYKNRYNNNILLIINNMKKID